MEDYERYFQSFSCFLYEIIVPVIETYFQHSRFTAIRCIHYLHRAGILVYSNQNYHETHIPISIRRKSATTLITKNLNGLYLLNILLKLEHLGIDWYYYKGEYWEYQQKDYIIAEEYNPITCKSGQSLSYLQYSQSKFHSGIGKNLYMIDLTTKDWKDIDLLLALVTGISAYEDYIVLRNRLPHNKTKKEYSAEKCTEKYAAEEYTNEKYLVEILKIIPKQTQYTIDGIFDGISDSRSDWIKEFEPLIESFLFSHRSHCILVLGHSQLRKSYFLSGISSYLIKRFEKNQDIISSYIQIYNNNIYDLFNTDYKLESIPYSWEDMFYRFKREEFDNWYSEACAYSRRICFANKAKQHSILRFRASPMTQETTFTIISLTGDEQTATSEHSIIKYHIDLKISNTSLRSKKSETRLDTLPSEIFTMIAEQLPLEYLKQLRLYKPTHYMAEYAIGRYYQVVRVHIGLEAARRLQTFFQCSLSQYTRTLIILDEIQPLGHVNERRHFLGNVHEVFQTFRNTLEDVDRNINVIFRGCWSLFIYQSDIDRCLDIFLYHFDRYKWPVQLDRICPRYLSRANSLLASARSLELVVPTYHNILEAKEGLLAFVSNTKKLSVAHELQLSPEEEHFLEELARSGIKIIKTHDDKMTQLIKSEKYCITIADVLPSPPRRYIGNKYIYRFLIC